MAGDEEKAILIYTTDPNGKPLTTEMLNPSLPFQAKRHQDTTPLHLAAFVCFEKLINIFLTHGGNPNVLNSHQETTLHCLCNKSDYPELRAKILKCFIDWKVIDGSGNVSESISLNRVDHDGNSAIHYAATHGLEACVELLVRAGVIVSIVNYSQRTCCELADSNAHTALATMIELALVYQPEDDNMISYRMAQQLAINPNSSNTASSSSSSGSSNNSFGYNTSLTRSLNASTPASLTIDSVSMHMYDLEQYLASLIHSICCYIIAHFHTNTLSFQTIAMSPARAETMLNTAAWDFHEVVDEITKNTEAFLKKCQLTANVEYTYIYQEIVDNANSSGSGSITTNKNGSINNICSRTMTTSSSCSSADGSSSYCVPCETKKGKCRHILT